jgi:hypothetical protein
MGLEGSAFEALERDFQEVLQVCLEWAAFWIEDTKMENDRFVASFDF